MLLKPMNKKGQFEDFLIVIVTIFIIGVLLFFSNHVVNQMYTSLDEWFNESTDFNESEAQTAVTKIQAAENSAWDYAFLAIFIGFVIQLVLFSFATRINVAFFWIFSILGIIELILGVIVSNIWMEMVENPEFATTITRFPITNSILGTYFPLAVVTIIFIGLIAMFGKPQS